MTDSISTHSLRTALKYPFQTPEAPGRFIVGSALLLLSLFIPIIPTLFVFGYVVRVMRGVIRGEEPALPEWNNWGQLGADGLRSLVTAAVYLGPGLVIMLGGWCLYLLMYLGGFSLINQSRHSAGAGLAIVLIMGAVAVLFLSLFASWLLTLIGGIPLPAALAHMAAREKLGAAFNVFEWGAILSADKWGYLIAWVVTLGLAAVLYCALLLAYFSVVLICLGGFIALPLGFYLLLVAGVVFAQAYREGAAQVKPSTPAQRPTPAESPAPAETPAPTPPASAPDSTETPADA
jgi:hypothetical protein